MALSKYILLFVIALVCNYISAPRLYAQMQCDTSFIKEYTGNGNIEPFAIKFLPSHAVLIAGKANDQAALPYHAMATQLAPDGAVVWSRLIQANAEDDFTGILPLSNGTFLLYGTTKSSRYTNGKILLVNVNGAGGIIWSRQIGLSAGSKDRIKAMLQYTDNDIVGTFNTDDSTTQSDPVVFKMDLNGNLKWATKFNNGDNESLTAVAFEANRIYAAGFYTGQKKQGVLSVLDAATGVVVSSENLYYNDTLAHQEVTDLEIYNNQLSLGLWLVYYDVNFERSSKILLRQDLAGNKMFETKIVGGFDTTNFICRRTIDDGFYVVRTSSSSMSAAPSVTKLNKYNFPEPGVLLSEQQFNSSQLNHSMDITNTGGAVSAGYYKNFLASRNKMTLVKTTSAGLVGRCQNIANGFFPDTAVLLRRSFTWTEQLPVTLGVNESITCQQTMLLINQVNICDSIGCTDITPLPPFCNQTSLVEYTPSFRSILRDAAIMADGGKIAVGEMGYNGFITKVKNNGDVAWSKKVDEFAHNISFFRVIKTSNDQVYVFGNNYSVLNNASYKTVKVLKMDNAGNILISREIITNYYSEVSDVSATPDGGFVIIINENYGSGSNQRTDVIRFSNTLQPVWKKQFDEMYLTVLRSVHAAADAVYVAADKYMDPFQVEVKKLDYATGTLLWNKYYKANGDAMFLNKVIELNDTVYVFFNKFQSTSPPLYDFHICMLRLTGAGGIINAVMLKSDNNVMFETFFNLDKTRPTVTLLPDNNFAFSCQVENAAGKALNITKFDKMGNGIWSKNYPALSTYNVYNLHTQDIGLLIVGTVERPQLLDAKFTSSFLLKTDSTGEIILNAGGSCTVESRPYTAEPIVAAIEESFTAGSVSDLQVLDIIESKAIPQDQQLDATLYCNRQTNCNNILIGTRGSTCNRADTLTFYLNNAVCGAAATWKYDTALFKQVFYSGDSLRLFPKAAGVSVVHAEIQTPCAIETQDITVSILLSAAAMSLGKDTSICPDASIRLQAGPGYLSYEWSDMSTDSVLTVSAPGIYFVKVIDNCGGISSDTLKVVPADTSFNITGLPEKCNKDSVLLSATTGFSNYTWSPQIDIISKSDSAIVYPVVTTMYYAEAERYAGCVVKDSFLVTVNSSPIINLGNDTSLCYDRGMRLSATAGFSSYTWSNGSQLSYIDIDQESQYFVSAVYNNGCVSVDTIEVKKYSFDQPFLGNDTSFCSGNQAVITPGTYQLYEWNGQAGNNTFIVNTPGDYHVKVTDENGCTGTDTITIRSLYSSPGNFLLPTDSICNGEKIVLQPTQHFESYQWSTAQTGKMITIANTGLYTLTVTDQNGCTGSDTLTVIEKQDCPKLIYFPSAFTPNNDIWNATFKPRIYGNVEEYHFSVYNRYGQVVFETTNSLLGWDGNYKAKAAAAGGYVFICSYKFSGGSYNIKKGTVLLIR